MAAKKKTRKSAKAPPRAFPQPNRQPFYHTLSLTFTDTADQTDYKRASLEKKLYRVFVEHFGKYSMPADTVCVDYFDAEPGDPSDLM